LNPKYKEKVREEIGNILMVEIIDPVKESEWVSPMVVEGNKMKGNIRNFCVRSMTSWCPSNSRILIFCGSSSPSSVATL